MLSRRECDKRLKRRRFVFEKERMSAGRKNLEISRIISFGIARIDILIF